MTLRPDFDDFVSRSAGGKGVAVFRRMLSDSLTPVAAFDRLAGDEIGCLFESVIGGEKVGRYSFLAFRPYAYLESFGKQVVYRHSSPTDPGQPATTDLNGWKTESFTVENPLDELRHRIESIQVAPTPGLAHFAGGAVGYVGYDAVRYVEHLPDAPPDDRSLPDISFGFYDQLVVFDNVTKTMDVVAIAYPDRFNGDMRRAYEDACSRIELVVEMLSSNQDRLRPADIEVEGAVELDYESNHTQAEYEAGVAKCVEYIRAGDIFQVVTSQRLKVPRRAEPLEVYRTLRVVNPSPFMFFVRAPQVTLVGSSPEIMVRVEDGKVTVRPLAGTRPRGADEQQDQQLAEELLADPKERAEHVMLVDLGRNDVGRVARYGTVELSDVMVIERYSHVMHITSNVTGMLKEDCDAFDALAACLPAGTVSGAPKVRAMEIIDEVEPHRRGPYAGAVGYIDFRGNMDTCIALRTMVITEDSIYVQAGAGIVADSVPANEYQETLNKARGLLRAIELTEDRLSSFTQ